MLQFQMEISLIHILQQVGLCKIRQDQSLQPVSPFGPCLVVVLVANKKDWFHIERKKAAFPDDFTFLEQSFQNKHDCCHVQNWSLSFPVLGTSPSQP